MRQRRSLYGVLMRDRAVPFNNSSLSSFWLEVAEKGLGVCSRGRGGQTHNTVQLSQFVPRLWQLIWSGHEKTPKKYFSANALCSPSTTPPLSRFSASSPTPGEGCTCSKLGGAHVAKKGVYTALPRYCYMTIITMDKGYLLLTYHTRIPTDHGNRTA